VVFGTSGHRSSSIDAAFDDQLFAGICQAICDYRRDQHIIGPLFVGHDAHGIAEPAWQTAIEVFAANDVTVLAASRDHQTPSPVISRAIVRHNYNGRGNGLADGVVITPAHNQPEDHWLKCIGVDGGPASAATAAWIGARVNELSVGKLRGVRRVPFTKVTIAWCDLLGDYVEELGSVVDLETIRRAGVRIGAEARGGPSSRYWQAIAERHLLDITAIDDDGCDCALRIDRCSSDVQPSPLEWRTDFDIAVGNDAEAGRHAIVTERGLMNPNDYLPVAIDHLLRHRPGWSPFVTVGKTVVGTSMIDRVAADLGRTLVEVPAGFRWFAPGLIAGRLMFAGEDNASATYLQCDGSPWTTDRDGIAMALLAAEIVAVTGESPSQRHAELARRHGPLSYAQTEVPANPDATARAAMLSEDDVCATELAGDLIERKSSVAAGNGQPIGGVKVQTSSGWFVARPSQARTGVTIHAESFRGAEHVSQIQAEACQIITAALER
jgi:phosphoglucomutase